VKKRIVNQRLVANAMEPRACVARFDPATGELTLWVHSQNPHVHRLLMCAFVLDSEHKVRVIAPDVGGGFGSKIFLYNEEVVCSVGLAAAAAAGFAVDVESARGVPDRPHGRDT